MRIPLLLADSIQARACRPKCEKFLTRPFFGQPICLRSASLLEYNVFHLLLTHFAHMAACGRRRYRSNNAAFLIHIDHPGVLAVVPSPPLPLVW